jgi:serine/threonine-protein kinase
MIGKRILNYQIISLLGEGGMGSVYKAYDLQLERYVAIKIINPKLIKDPHFIERFRFEAKNQAKLNHPNIVTVYGFIETREATGFVMEFVDGSTISQLINNYGRLDLIYSLRVMQQVLLAIEYAHSMGFIHRDLKPSNIIIDKNGLVKVMDFGISKSLKENQNITRLGSNIGTIYYMSPEQIKGLSTTPRTDIYSLGITLYEMLSGTVPFNFKNDYDIYEAHLKMQPQKLSTVFTDIPKEIDDLILSALNKSDKNNFNNAFEFRNSIEHLIFNLPLLLNNQSSAYEYSRKNPVKKNKPANLIIGFVLLLTILIIGSSYLLVDKFIIKEKSLSNSEDRSKINYLEERKYFSTSWEKLKTNISGNINNLISVDSKIFASNTNGTVLMTPDFGQRWIKVLESLGNTLNEFETLNDNILTVNSSGQLLVIDNKGNIKRNDKLSNEKLTALNIGQNLLISGSGGLLLKSDKNKFSFQKIDFPSSTAILDVFELDNSILFCCTFDGKVYKTTDYGKTWSFDKLNDSYLKKFWFINSFRGFVIGSNGSLFKTTDGGTNWTKIMLNTNATLNDIIFVNQKSGYIITSEGEIFISENSGDDWIRETVNEIIPLNKIIILRSGTVLIASNNGLILKNKI